MRLGEVLYIEDVAARNQDAVRLELAAESSAPSEVLAPGTVVVAASVVLGFAIDR